MAKNDQKVKQLMKALETKKESLGKKPAKNFKGNGLIEDITGNKVNLNTIVSISGLISLMAHVTSLFDAAEVMIDAAPTLANSELDKILDDLDDINLVASLLEYNAKKRDLDKIQSKLDSLLSEDAKIEDELNSIEDLLK